MPSYVAYVADPARTRGADAKSLRLAQTLRKAAACCAVHHAGCDDHDRHIPARPGALTAHDGASALHRHSELRRRERPRRGCAGALPRPWSHAVRCARPPRLVETRETRRDVRQPPSVDEGVVCRSAGIIPYTGIQFAVFDMLKAHIPADADGQSRNLYKLCAGAAAGVVSQSASYPIDTVRRRMQLQGAGGAERLYSTAFGCTLHMLRKEGAAAFYRGVSANLLRAVRQCPSAHASGVVASARRHTCDRQAERSRLSFRNCRLRSLRWAQAPNTAIQFTLYDNLAQILDLKK
eukprot:SAG11_NODE_3261_length_2571_cov_8.876214_1_plen_293_part_00